MNKCSQIAYKCDDILKENHQSYTAIKELNRLKYFQIKPKTILDVGIGTGLTLKGYLNEKTKSVLGIDSSKEMLKRLNQNSLDSRVKIAYSKIEEINIQNNFEASYFILTLPWLENYESAIEKAAKITEDYVIIVDQNLESFDDDMVKKKWVKEVNLGSDLNLKEVNYNSHQIKKEVIDKILSKKEFYLLLNFEKRIVDGNKNPAGVLQTLVYSKTKTNTHVYENAKKIFKVTGYCNRKCPGCYSRNIKDVLNPEIYLEHLNSIKSGETIALRGGEISLIDNWFDSYVKPAIERNIKTIIETNGYFLDKEDLVKFSNPNISVKIGFDRIHLAPLVGKDKSLEFERLYNFAVRASQLGIKFEFFSLGMDAKQIAHFLAKTKLSNFKNKFNSLTYYDNVKKLKLVENIFSLMENLI